MKTQTEIHNQMAGQIVASIVKPPLEAGGQYTDVLVLLESVILGVVLMAVKLGGDEIVLDEVMLHVKERLAEQRLSGIETSGGRRGARAQFGNAEPYLWPSQFGLSEKGGRGMTAQPIPETFSVERSLERNDDGIPCPCGGYADRVDCTPDEIREHGCGRSWECCSRAFVCRVCKTRYAGSAPAPEME